MSLIEKINNKLATRKEYAEASAIYQNLKEFTMISSGNYMENILLAKRAQNLEGAVVECGVWRGGMSAGMASVLGTNREYFLYDSYEGLPDAGELDGQKAKDWQKFGDKEQTSDNCTAEISFAQTAMKKAGINNAHFVKGWFKDTVPHHDPNKKIAVLRLDGDWYDSTMDCLVHLYDHVVEGGIIIFDDYYHWDGCTLALHDFLSERKLPLHIKQYNNLICYIEKKTNSQEFKAKK